jgi:tetratricopeptide (TPR) repeat protein
VPQKFELAIDLEHENPEIQIGPVAGKDQRVTGAIEEFRFDPAMLDTLFADLAPEGVSNDGAAAASAFSMARDYLSKGLLERASAETSRAMGRGGSRAEGLLLHGEIFTRQGLYGEALERYKELNRGESITLQSMQGEVRALLHLGRGREALALAESMLESAPDDVETLILCANTRASAGDPVLALRALDHARRLAPVRAELLARTGDILRSMADIDSAIAAYRHALQLDGDYAGVRFELARLLISRGDLREAERELEAALETLPTYSEATLELCTLRRRSGKLAEALKGLVDLLKEDPDNLSALVALGEALIAAEREPDAQRAFERVLRFDAENVGALYHQGVLHAKRHRYRDAVALWERVVDLEPVSEFARRARRDAKTALDLTKIFGSQPAA